MLVFIATTSYDEIPQKYLDDCKEILDDILSDNDLIFGACRRGIMGLAYNSAKTNHRKIIGVCPTAYQDDFDGADYDEKIITPTITEATDIMLERSDAVLVLPGGFGTIYEFSQAIQNILCGAYSKPIIIYNSQGFFDNLLEHIKKLKTEKFVDSKTLKLFKVVSTKSDLLKIFATKNHSN